MTANGTTSDARRQLLEKLRRGELHDSNGALEPLISRPQDAPVPLSPGQEQIWFHAELAGAAPIYTESVTIHKRGPLDPAVLERCFNEIVRRHESWRSSFPMSDGKVIQRIEASVLVSLPFDDLSHLPVEKREAEAVRIATEDARRPFDLNMAPLFRARLVRFAEDYHRIYLTVHHLVFDGVSIYRVLIGELAALYKAFSAGQESPLPELTVQYGDYALSKQQRLEAGGHAAEMEYWRETLSRDLPTLELPSERPRPAEPTWRGGMETFAIPVQLTEQLNELARGEGVTPYMALLAVFQLLLYRYSGQDEIVVGGATNTRTRPEFEQLIGYLLNPVVFRTPVESGISFRDFLARVKSTVLGALSHSDIPFDAIVRELAPKRDSSRHPLFQVLFSMRPPFADFPDGWDVTDMEIHNGASSFDLFVEFSEHPQGLAGRFVYNADLFDRATILRMLGHFQVLLQQLAAHPDLPVAQVPLLTEAERKTLIEDWNKTDQSFPNQCLHELFEAQAERSPEHPALIFRGRRLTYAELNTRSNKLAHFLIQNGAGSGSLIGVHMERSFEMVVALLAILKSGAAYVPFDPELPLSRLDTMLDDSRPLAVITERKFGENLASYSGKTVLLDSPCEDIEVQPASNPGRPVEPADAIYAIYTSGSTGVPKAAVNTHEALTNRILWMQDRYPLEASDRVLQKTPYSFDVSVWEFFWPMAVGATLVIAEPGGHKDPSYIAGAIASERITTIHFVPSMLREFLEAGHLERCGSLKRVFASGEALPPDLPQKFYRHLKARLHNLYGPTEAAVDVTYWDCPKRAPGATVPIGRPISNVKAYILDRFLAPVPIGVAGELNIGGIALARGYLNRPELTAERFIPDPFDKKPGARLYKTGDRARFLADGNIEYLGRLDNQVKLRGFRIELGDIESTILQHDQVRGAAAVLRQHQNGEMYLIAYAVRSDSTLDSRALKAFLKERLPEYMVPAHIEFLDSLPMLSSGKLNRSALPAPERAENQPANEFVAARNSAEEHLVAIWEKLLEHRPIGIRDNFFDLGGHSLLLIRLITQIQQEFGQRLPVATVFGSPTIEALAAVLSGPRTSPAVVCRVIPIKPQGTRPPFICLGASPLFLPLARLLGPDQPFCGLDLTELNKVQLPKPCRLEDLGAYVVEAIRKYQPEGPYSIGGWCLYGVLAYEAARQLLAQGHQVELLTLIDSPNSGYDRSLPPVARFEMRAQKWLFHLTNLVKSRPAEMIRYSMERIRIFQGKMQRRRERIVMEAGLHEADLSLMDIDPIAAYAATTYDPPPYSGRVLMVQSEERPPGKHWQMPVQWAAPLMNGGIIYYVQGGHQTMFEFPYVEALAANMKSCFDELGEMPAKAAASAAR